MKLEALIEQVGKELNGRDSFKLETVMECCHKLMSERIKELEAKATAAGPNGEPSPWPSPEERIKELEDQIEGLEDKVEILNDIVVPAQNNEKLWRSEFFKAEERVKELETQNNNWKELVTEINDSEIKRCIHLRDQRVKIKELEQAIDSWSEAFKMEQEAYKVLLKQYNEVVGK